MEAPKNSIWKETGIMALGQLICVAGMLGVFALLKQLNLSVLLGSIVGGILAVAYYLSMVICADIAAKKAMTQDVKGGQALMQTAQILRMLGLFGIWVLCALSKQFNLIALVLPVVFVRPIIVIANRIQSRKGVIS